MRISRKKMGAVALGIVGAMTLAACGAAAEGEEPPANGGDNGAAAEPAPDAGGDDHITLTWGAWDLDRVVEFRAMAAAFNEAHPNITVETVDYPNAEWSVAMTADLAAGAAPDIVTLRTLPDFVTWGEGGMLRDVSHLAAQLDPATSNREVFSIDGEVLGLPFRQDHWIVFYNKDLFEAAGVDFPDGQWTWEDYIETARALQGNLPDGVHPAYQHIWGDSTVAGFAAVQTPGADVFSGDFSFLAPFYERALIMDAEGLQPSFGTVSTGSLHHLAEFGQQRVAMVPMGSWFMSQLLDPNNDVEDFAWGVAAVPQIDSSTFANPISQAGATGAAINAAIDESKVEAAETFLKFLADEGGAKAIAGLGLVPPLTNDAVMDVMFSVPGMPTDDVSRAAITTVDGHTVIPVHPNSAVVQQIFNDTHSEIMTNSISIADAIQQANDRFASERVD